MKDLIAYEPLADAKVIRNGDGSPQRPTTVVSVRLLRGLDRRKAVYEEQAKGGLYDVKVTKGTLVRFSTYVHVKVTTLQAPGTKRVTHSVATTFDMYE